MRKCFSWVNITPISSSKINFKKFHLTTPYIYCKERKHFIAKLTDQEGQY